MLSSEHHHSKCIWHQHPPRNGAVWSRNRVVERDVESSLANGSDQETIYSPAGTATMSDIVEEVGKCLCFNRYTLTVLDSGRVAVSVTEAFARARPTCDLDFFATMDLSTCTSSCVSGQTCWCVNVHRLYRYYFLNWLCVETGFTATKIDITWCYMSIVHAMVPRLHIRDKSAIACSTVLKKNLVYSKVVLYDGFL